MSTIAPATLAIDGSAFSVGVVAARYNEELVDALLAQAIARLRAAGVKERKLIVERVPGSNELPVAVQLLATRMKLDAVIALGVLIRGDTIQYEVIAEAMAQALQQVALATRTPVINGIIAVENRSQAEARCRGPLNRGGEFAAAALEMAALKRRLGK